MINYQQESSSSSSSQVSVLSDDVSISSFDLKLNSEDKYDYPIKRHINHPTMKRSIKKGEHKGLTLRWFCVCKFNHHGYKVVQKHIKTCKKRTEVIRRISLAEQTKHKDFEIQVQKKSSNPIDFHSSLKMLEEKFQKRFEVLEQQRISSLTAHQQQGNSLTMKIFESCKDEIIGIIKRRLKASINDAILCGIDVSKKESSLTENFAAKFRTLNFDDCILFHNEKLKAAHQILMKQKRRIETLQRHQRSYNFLNQFSEFELMTQVNFFEKFLGASKTQRVNVSKYWGRIRIIDPYFQKFPLLPSIPGDKSPNCMMLSLVSIQDASRQIVRQVFPLNPTLASDMWLIVISALRFKDLLKIRLKTIQGHFVKSVCLIESKNFHKAKRYIPISMLEISQAGKVHYPATQVRLRNAVRECLTRFKSCYGFKHRAISMILSSLHRSSNYGDLHKSSSTTFRHYIDRNSQHLMNGLFKLPEVFRFTSLKRQEFENRKYELDLTKGYPIFTQIKQVENETELMYQIKDEVSSRTETAALDGHYEDLQTYETQPFMRQIAYVSKNHQIQIEDQTYCRLDEAIFNFNETALRKVEDQVNFQKQVPSLQSFAEALSSVISRDVIVYRFQENRSNPQIIKVQSSQLNENQLEMVIVTDNKSFRTSAVTEEQRNRRYCFVNAKDKLNSYTLKFTSPNCPQCQKRKQFGKLVSNVNLSTNCSNNCGYEREPLKKQKLQIRSELIIKSSSKNIIDHLRILEITSKNNKIKKTIDKQYPGKWTLTSYYSQIPNVINSVIPSLSPQLDKDLIEFEKHEEYLPLEIKQSGIPESGKGVFSLVQIEPNTIIVSYKGEVGSNFSTDPLGNSIFSCGWLHNSKDQQFEILLDGQKRVSLARYINSSPSSNQANCSILLATGQTKIYVLIYSKKKIKPQQQLLYFYGNSYWLKSSPQTNIDSSKVQEGNQQAQINLNEQRLHRLEEDKIEKENLNDDLQQQESPRTPQKRRIKSKDQILLKKKRKLN